MRDFSCLFGCFAELDMGTILSDRQKKRACITKPCSQKFFRLSRHNHPKRDVYTSYVTLQIRADIFFLSVFMMWIGEKELSPTGRRERSGNIFIFIIYYLIILGFFGSFLYVQVHVFSHPSCIIAILVRCIYSNIPFQNYTPICKF